MTVSRKNGFLVTFPRIIIVILIIGFSKRIADIALINTHMVSIKRAMWPTNHFMIKNNRNLGHHRTFLFANG